MNTIDLKPKIREDLNRKLYINGIFPTASILRRAFHSLVPQSCLHTHLSLTVFITDSLLRYLYSQSTI